MKELLEYLEANYSETHVCSLFDEEVLNWVEDGWEDDYEDDYEWYGDHNNGEAQDVIIDQIIDEIKNKFPDLDSSIDLHDLLKDRYDCLNY